MTKIAVILAAGSGRRFGADTPKQFLKVAGVPILELTLRAFESAPDIDRICVVAHPDHFADVNLICEKAGISKFRAVIPGGEERRDSAIAAIRHLSSLPDDSIILFHDAARPLVSQRIIRDCVEALSHYDAAAAGIPSSDTLWEVDENRLIARIPQRSRFFRAQTPQAFRLGTIRNAYLRAASDPGFVPTDDCGVLKRYDPDTNIAVIDGDPANIKVTFPDDIAFVESFLNSKKSIDSSNP
ncbi:MAG: 2-C-methyl-D-erythritol 4-phosphate cytidylyltransferase [Muribaculaceae bacterium]|nr:2-C-methyl-D-erythritol 4-phosphate cytidylyltransferase [Muribaculaceae bacterium]